MRTSSALKSPANRSPNDNGMDDRQLEDELLIYKNLSLVQNVIDGNLDSRVSLKKAKSTKVQNLVP